MRIGEAKNVQELISAVETARIRRLEARRGWEVVWWNSLALIAGDHHAAWNPDLAKFEDVDPTWRNNKGKKPRLVINHALTVARTELSKLTKGHPIMDIIANSDEAIDLAAAKVGKSALEFAEWKFKLRKRRKTALWWMIATGLGAIYVGFDHLDDTAGNFPPFVIDPATGEPTFNPLRKQELQKMVDDGEIPPLKEETYPLGEIEYRVYSPMQLLPDETTLEFSEIKDLITTDIIDVDVLQGVVGRSISGLTPDNNLQLGTMDRRMLARAGVPTLNGREPSVENGVAVHTFWLLPNVYRGNKFLKNGIMIRWCKGNQKVDNTERFPFQDNRMPFVFFEHIPSATSIWPDCVMNHIRGPNLEIDKTVSQLIENKDYMANPMWRVATQHRIRGEIKNVAGGVVRYRHVPNVPPPEPIPGIQMPAQVESILVNLRDQILDISGQSEASRGRVPTGVRSGVAVAYLTEEDDTRIGPTVENMEEAIALQGSLTLERFSQYYVVQRILRFYRRDGSFDVLKFKGADLKNNTDVVTQAGSAMPKSKAARQNFILELASMGLETDPDKIKQELDLGYGEPDDREKAVAQANRENGIMLHGYPETMAREATPDEHGQPSIVPNRPTAVPVKEWHNHAVHIQRHTSVMMDEEFDQLSISNPEIVRIFDEHLAMHKQAEAAQQQQEMMMMLAAKGGPDGPPGAASQPAREVRTRTPVPGPNGSQSTAITTVPR